METLGKAWNETVANGWTVVNIKDGWNTIFPLEKK